MELTALSLLLPEHGVILSNQSIIAQPNPMAPTAILEKSHRMEAEVGANLIANPEWRSGNRKATTSCLTALDKTGKSNYGKSRIPIFSWFSRQPTLRYLESLVV